jgi:hypothetical protein
MLASDTWCVGPGGDAVARASGLYGDSDAQQNAKEECGRRPHDWRLDRREALACGWLGKPVMDDFTIRPGGSSQAVGNVR